MERGGGDVSRTLLKERGKVSWREGRNSMILWTLTIVSHNEPHPELEALKCVLEDEGFKLPTQLAVSV